MPTTGPPYDQPATGLVGWLDVSAGVAGDMVLGALVGAGAEVGQLQRLVDLVLPGTVRLDVSEVTRAGLRATKVDVVPLVADHPHRRWAEIRDLIGAAEPELPAPVSDGALRVFARLAAVEGAVHGVAVDDVEFHEVGSWDSIADVVGACAGLHLLGVTDLVAGPVAVGSGAVRTAHGRLPVPVPAVLGLLEGWTAQAGGTGELATPTGVALVTTLAREVAGMPAMRPVRTGVGAGTRDTADAPNVVRLVLGRPAAPSSAPTTAEGSGDEGPLEMVVLEANVDDLDPRVWPTVLTALLGAGAADAWLVPIVMKKGRPAHTLAVLVAPSGADAVRRIVFTETTTIGLRESRIGRQVLARETTTVTVDGQVIRMKIARLAGAVVNAVPEYDDVAAAATALGRPAKAVLVAATAAAAAAGLAP